MEKLIDIATLVVAGSALLVAGVVLLERGAAPTTVNPVVAYLDDWKELASAGHRRGPANAAVTIIEFGDYRCRFCREADVQLQAILRQYEGEIGWVYRHFPIQYSPDSPSDKAAWATECAAGQGLFWQMHTALMSETEWQQTADMETFATLAERVGVPDRAAFEACFGRDEPPGALEVDRGAAQRAAVTGTPTFLVNGLKYVGVIDSIEFKQIFAEALER